MIFLLFFLLFDNAWLSIVEFQDFKLVEIRVPSEGQKLVDRRDKIFKRNIQILTAIRENLIFPCMNQRPREIP